MPSKPAPLVPIPTDLINAHTTGKFLVTQEMLVRIPDLSAVKEALYQLTQANPDYIFHWVEDLMDGGYWIKWRKKRHHEPKPDGSEDMRDLPRYV